MQQLKTLCQVFHHSFQWHVCPKQNAFVIMAVVLARMAAVEAVWLVELVVVVARFVVVVARKARMVQMAKVVG